MEEPNDEGFNRSVTIIAIVDSSSSLLNLEKGLLKKKVKTASTLRPKIEWRFRKHVWFARLELPSYSCNDSSGKKYGSCSKWLCTNVLVDFIRQLHLKLCGYNLWFEMFYHKVLVEWAQQSSISRHSHQLQSQCIFDEFCSIWHLFNMWIKYHIQRRWNQSIIELQVVWISPSEEEPAIMPVLKELEKSWWFCDGPEHVGVEKQDIVVLSCLFWSINDSRSNINPIFTQVKRFMKHVSNYLNCHLSWWHLHSFLVFHCRFQKVSFVVPCDSVIFHSRFFFNRISKQMKR